MEKTGAKFILLDHQLEIAVARSDDAHVHSHLPVFADTEHAIFLEHTQQSGLEGGLQVGNLIEKQHPSFRRAYQPCTLALRAGESATPVSKKFALPE